VILETNPDLIKASCGPINVYTTNIPPSKGKMAPVIKSEADEERNIIAPIISSASVILFRGVLLIMSLSLLGFDHTYRVISVLTNPGAIAFAKILYLAHSTAKVLVKDIIPALLTL